ncbi:MAG: class I SAM-dependent methyltransferase [Pseudomonadota bacterium]
MDTHVKFAGRVDGAPPLCPVTGEPAERLIQYVPVTLLRLMWRCLGWTDVSRLFAGIDKVGLWVSPCGLAFFSPAIEGDDAFYKAVYGRFKFHEMLAEIARERPEFIEAACHVAAGDRVLDAGAGSAGFRHHVEHAEFTGLDPYAETEQEGVLPEHADTHAARLPEHYDVVTSFQVMEHTTDPLAFAKTLDALLKPGGTLILGVPLWPSPMTDCLNMPINCPPHHLTWWNAGALTSLAEALGYEVVDVQELPPHRHHDWFHWMPKFTWVKSNGQYYANRISWHFNFLFSLPLSVLSAKFLGAPKQTKPIDILLVARKPG